MPFATGTGEATVQFTCTGDAEPMLVTFGFRMATQPSLAKAEEVKLSFWTAFTGYVSSAYKIRAAALRWQLGPNTQIYSETTSAETAMGGAATALPSNCALIVQKKTAFGGKRNRGRFYVPGVPEGEVDPVGALAGAYRTAVQGKVNTLLTELRSSLAQLVIHHSSLQVVNGKPAWVIDPTIEPTEITSFNIPAKIGTQRRRMATRTFTVG